MSDLVKQLKTVHSMIPAHKDLFRIAANRIAELEAMRETMGQGEIQQWAVIAEMRARIAELEAEVDLLSHARDRECGHCHKVLTEGTFCSDACKIARRAALKSKFDW